MLRPGAVLLSVLSALLACRAPPPAPATPPPIVVPPVAAAAAAADAGVPEASAPQEPVTLSAPQPVACTFDPTGLHFALAIDGRSPAFASLSKPSGAFTIPEGPATRGGFVEHSSGGIRIRGVVPSDTVTFYAKKPVALGGWLVPRASTQLRWAAGETNALLVEPFDDLRDSRATSVRFLDAPRSAVSCQDVAFVEATKEWDGKTWALRGRRGTTQYVKIREGIPLSRAASEPPVAELTFEYADSAQVLVVERRGAYALVVADAWEPATLFGWIPTSVFVAPPRALTGGHHTRAPTVRMGVTDLRLKRTVVCESDVRLVASVAGRQAFIGTISARTPIVYRIDERPSGSVDVEIEDLYVYREARVTVRSADVEGCVTPR